VSLLGCREEADKLSKGPVDGGDRLGDRVRSEVMPVAAPRVGENACDVIDMASGGAPRRGGLVLLWTRDPTSPCRRRKVGALRRGGHRTCRSRELVPLPRKWNTPPPACRGLRESGVPRPRGRCHTGCRKPRTARTSGTVLGVELGYAPVLTAKQDLDRQIDALTIAGIATERIYLDKKSGATTDRPRLRVLLDYARSGDVIVTRPSSTTPPTYAPPGTPSPRSSPRLASPAAPLPAPAAPAPRAGHRRRTARSSRQLTPCHGR